MRTRREVVIGGAALAATSRLLFAGPASGTETQDPRAGLSLDFDESFAMIDPDVWYAGAKPSTFDTGFYGRSAFSRIGGEEGYNPYDIVDDPQTDNGKALQISLRYIGRQMHVPNYYGNNNPDFQWISGNLQTAKPDGTILKGWREGYFEARIWFPAHPLSFPAFWLMNGRSILYPKTSIELDVVEQKGWERNLYGAYLHEWGQPGEHHEGTGVPTDVDITSGYFRYGVLVKDSRFRLYFEDKPVIDQKTGKPVDWKIGRTDEMKATNDVFWPILTLAMAADTPVPKPLKPEHQEAHMRVDYVRVYV
jgi:beta-glucanase (GH16 family)